MLAFDFLFLAILLAFYLTVNKDKKNLLAVFIGSMFAILLSSFKALFLFSRRIVTYSFSSCFFYVFIRQSFLPCIILFAIFFLLFKDDSQAKAKYFLPLELSFYMIYLPYCIVSTSGALYSKYTLFIKPIIFAAMILQCSISINAFFRLLNKRSYVPMVIHSLIFVFYLLLPALTESLFYLEDKILLPSLFALISVLIPSVFVIFENFVKKKID